MEDITLEKIELVKDRTGVSYKEAKEALEFTGGSVVDAIIYIEENIDGTEAKKKSAGEADKVIASIKEAVRKGNVSKIIVKREGSVILNIPVNVGIIGTLIAPWGMIAGVLVAFGTKCSIELVKEDGSVVDVSTKAGEAIETAKDKSGVIFDEFKDKGGDLYGYAKEKGAGLYEMAKDKGNDLYEKAKGKGSDLYEKARDKGGDLYEMAKDKGSDLYEKAKDKGGDLYEMAKDRTSDFFKSRGEEVKDAVEDAKDAVESAAERAEAFFTDDSNDE